MGGPSDVVVNILDFDIVVSSNSSRAIMFTFKLGNFEPTNSPQLWVT